MKKYLLIIILCIAAILRFYQLGQNPPSLTWDEVAWGYNAYSIGIDGRDEFGKFLPVTYLESFGDFKPPVYAYLDVVPVKLFGLTEFATRFPSAFFGVLTVLLSYFLVQEMSFLSKRRDWYGLSVAFLLAISPWHIMLSRAAFEANVATFFIVCGVWLFLYALRKNTWFLTLSFLSFIVSMYTFNSARIVAPLLVILLCISHMRILWKNKKQIVLAGGSAFLVFLPLFFFLLTPQARLRFREVNIFTDENIVITANQEIVNDQNAWWSKIIHNRRWLYTQSFLHHYFDNLTPNFLFIQGDGNPKFATQDVGELYLWDLPFLILGILFLFRKREGEWFLVPCWLLLGIIPAATARETPHALRIEAVIPTLQILIGYGLVEGSLLIAGMHKSSLIKKTIYSFISLLLVVSVSYFVHGYYAHYPREYSGEWQYGYKDAIAYVKSQQNNFDNIVVTDALGRPYIYYLFYLKITPGEFRKNAHIERDVFGFVTISSLEKFHFSKTPNLEKLSGKTLYINLPSDVPPGATILKQFPLRNNIISLSAYTQ